MRQLLALTLITFCCFVTADPGDLDLSFGKRNGYILMSNSGISSIIQQTDGKLAVSGWKTNDDGTNAFTIQRYFINGEVDTSFQSQDKGNAILYSQGCTNSSAASLTKQSDEKLVMLVGCANIAGYALIRYLPDGSIDTTFGVDGFVKSDFINESVIVFSDTLQTDGKIVLVGQKNDQNGNDYYLLRLNSDGTRDTNFGANGEVFVHWSSYEHTPNQVKEQSDGKLLVAGDANTGAGIVSSIARFNQDGSIDTTFNSIGVVDFDLPITTSQGETIALGNLFKSVHLQNDGKIVLSAEAFVSWPPELHYTPSIIRLNTDGTLDSTFNGTGVGVLDVTIDDMYGTATLLLLQTGKFMEVTATSITPYQSPVLMVLTRHNEDGTIDTSFHDNGKLIALPMLIDSFPETIFEQADGRLVVSSNTNVSALARYLIDDSDDGDDNHDELGHTVTTADIDGDGVDDVISGAPEAKIVNGTTTLAHAGMIKIISGKDHTVLKRFKGTSANQHFGSAVVAVPDQDSDGVKDLLVGDPQHGTVSLISGATGTVIKALLQQPSAGPSPAGASHGQFGAALAYGDANNDGAADVIVGAPGANTVYVYDGTTVFNTVNPAPLYGRSSANGGKFGASVVVDNQHRLLVGSPMRSALNISTGKKMAAAGVVEVFAGSDGSSAALTTLSGTTVGEHFGSAVSAHASTGNWAVGSEAYSSHPVVNGKVVTHKNIGRVQIFSSTDGSLLKTLDGNADRDHFGSSLAAQSDLDADGSSEVIVGSAKSDVSKPVNGKYTLLKTSGRVHVLNGTKVTGP